MLVFDEVKIIRLCYGSCIIINGDSGKQKSFERRLVENYCIKNLVWSFLFPTSYELSLPKINNIWQMLKRNSCMKINVSRKRWSVILTLQNKLWTLEIFILCNWLNMLLIVTLIKPLVSTSYPDCDVDWYDRYTIIKNIIHIV